MYDLFIMDMGGHDANVLALQERFPHGRTIRYYDNHLDTIRRCIKHARTPWIWVISGCCDYTKFNFDYRAVPWEAYQLHCWASGTEKFGDTFLINVDKFKAQWDIALLEWYKDINWHRPGVPRLPWPITHSPDENITKHVKNIDYPTPYVWVNDWVAAFDPPLWNKRAFYAFNEERGVSLAPREIKTSVGRQIYDFPYIIKQKTKLLEDFPIDTIYISNGEPEEERWYTHLLKVRGSPVKWVKGVNGRAAAYKAAAKKSKTPWFFTVFAKLEVVEDFNWNWQPDYLQEPKHYIFHSRNPVNGLEYGHMGIIAYNRQLVLDTNEHGLDFTLSKPHAVVPRLSAVAHYNTTPELTWRTAFREVIKLKDDVVKTGSVESEYRLETWLTVADGDYAEFSILGARDAVGYYNEVKGDYTELMRSFEWAWLREYYAKKYSV